MSILSYKPSANQNKMLAELNIFLSYDEIGISFKFIIWFLEKGEKTDSDVKHNKTKTQNYFDYNTA